MNTFACPATQSCHHHVSGPAGSTLTITTNVRHIVRPSMGAQPAIQALMQHSQKARTVSGYAKLAATKASEAVD